MEQCERVGANSTCLKLGGQLLVKPLSSIRRYYTVSFEQVTQISSSIESRHDMNTKPTDEVAFGTSTSVSGDWKGVEYDVLNVDNGAALALLMVCVTGDAPLCEKIGKNETQRSVDRCLKRIVQTTESFGGRPAEAGHNEVVAEFDHPDDALKAALEMLRRVADLPPVSGVELMLRIGFSYGAIVENSMPLSSEIARTATSLALLAKPGQIAACIRAQSALSPQMSARYDAHCHEWQLPEKEQASISSQKSPSTVAVEREGVSVKKSTEYIRPKSLLLKYGGNIFVLDDQTLEITIGRDPGNQVVIQGRHASRFHANIKRRGREIILSDTSTNGTFISFLNDAPHLLLIQGECVLRGGGVLSFSTADPSTGIGTTSVRFEVL